MKPVRLLIAGLGARAQTWLEVIDADPEVVIVGFCDPDGKARAKAAERYPQACPAADLESLVQRVEADAVLLATPPANRAAQIEAACAAGLFILAEKPLADSVAEAERFVAMARESGVPLMVGLNFRYLDVTRALKAHLEAATVGKAEFARFTYERWRDGRLPRLNKYPLVMRQPMLWEQSVHHFDLMRFVYGAEPVRIYARTFNPSWSMYRDDANVSAIIDFDSGLTVNYQGTWQGNWQALGFEWRTECSRGVLVQGDMFGELSYALRDDPAVTPVALPAHQPWISDARALLRAFKEAFRGLRPLECSGSDHLNSLRMLQACILSSERGQAVTLAELQTGSERGKRPAQATNS